MREGATVPKQSTARRFPSPHGLFKARGQIMSTTTQASEARGCGVDTCREPPVWRMAASSGGQAWVEEVCATHSDFGLEILVEYAGNDAVISVTKS